jgi:hypothetical protein
VVLVSCGSTDLQVVAAMTRAGMELLRNARIVAEYWRDEMMEADGPLRACSHPLAMVLAALDGETEPAQMGIPADEYNARLAASPDPEGPANDRG